MTTDTATRTTRTSGTTIAGSTTIRHSPGRQQFRPLLAIALIWVGAVVAIAAADGFVAAASLPPWPILLAVVIPVGLFVLGLRIPSTRQAVLGTDPRIWLALQLWRVVGAAFLFGWAGGELDAGFAVPAGIGDIATGLAALWLLTLVMRYDDGGGNGGGSGNGKGALRNRHLVAFTALGMGDFAVAVFTGALLRPDGLETLPWILFPALAVPFFTMVHIVNWMQLRQPAETAWSTIRR